MTTPRIYLKSNGSILLGDKISCDGFAYDPKIRVQTHIHSDHMIGFDTSKANQLILMSHETRALLYALRNADLPYHTNITSIAAGTCYSFDDGIIELLPSYHMLGSMQVKVCYTDGYKVGYSSDFFWPIDNIIEVDELLVDATYGSPECVRTYKQSHVDEHLMAVVSANLRAGKSTSIIGHHGRVEYAVHLLGNESKVPIICSPRVFALVNVYGTNGYSMPHIFKSDSSEAIEILRNHQLCLAFVSMAERRHLPWVDRLAKVTLSAYMTEKEVPILSYGNGDYRVAFTDHADFKGTLQYIAATGAKIVWTDPRSGNAEALAVAVRQQLGIEAQIAQRLESRGWG